MLGIAELGGRPEGRRVLSACHKHNSDEQGPYEQDPGEAASYNSYWLHTPA